MKKLAESIILQCIEDLWDRTFMKQSTKFFSQRGFSICATIAEMDICDQIKLLELVNRSVLILRSEPPAQIRPDKELRSNTTKAFPLRAALSL
ncbi:MAG: hypothetical protein HZA15_01825 [Nitrospirae bacterium]|nr:hypothetical protein [Nitrospirota bacterium]